MARLVQSGGADGSSPRLLKLEFKSLCYVLSALSFFALLLFDDTVS